MAKKYYQLKLNLLHSKKSEIIEKFILKYLNNILKDISILVNMLIKWKTK